MNRFAKYKRFLILLVLTALAFNGCAGGEFFGKWEPAPFARAGVDSATGTVYEKDEDREADQRSMFEYWQDKWGAMPSWEDLFPKFGYEYSWSSGGSL